MDTAVPCTADDCAPRVTVGLPVYNGANYVAQAIESLLAQTFTDFELIISDNASTDETEAICRGYAARDPRIRYYRQARNQGGMWNFNHLVGLARGTYFKWAAHDDLCAPTYLAQCVEILDRHPDVVWSYAQSAKIDPAGQQVTVDPEEGFGPCGLIHSSQAGFPRAHHDAPAAHRRFQGVVLGASWAVDFFGVIRTDALRRTRLVPRCYGGEKVLTAELALHGSSYEVPETLLLTRVHPAASGQDNSAGAQGGFNARRREFTRLRLLTGYVQALRNAPLGFAARVRCWWVLLQYLLQVRKWGKVLRNAWAGAGVGNRKRRAERVSWRESWLARVRTWWTARRAGL